MARRMVFAIQCLPCHAPFAAPFAAQLAIRLAIRRAASYSFFPMLDIQGAFPLDATRIIRTTQILICLCKQSSTLWYTVKANNLLLV